MSVKKWFIPLILIICILLSLVNFALTDILPVSVIKDNSVKIIIDAGHGGFDGGAVAKDGTEEKELNLSVALKINDFCNAFGYETVLVRDEDEAINTEGNNLRTKKVSDMKNRLKLMQQYPNAIYISVHMNKYEDAKPHGAQIFYSHKNEMSKSLAILIQSSIIEYVQKDNTRQVKAGNKDIYLLDNATIPTVITECGFLSNTSDLTLLKDEAYQSKLAFAIFLGIDEFLKRSKL